MAQGNLTTLAHVKLWLGLDAEQVDEQTDRLLNLLIAGASRMVLGYLGRPSLEATDVSEVYDGYGNNFMMLRQWPVLSLKAIQFFGVTIDKESTGNPRTPGYILSPDTTPQGGMKRVTLWGHSFPRGRSAISVDYRVGYVTEERHTIGEELKVETHKVWLADEGVHFVQGLEPLIRVESDPQAGQYSVDEEGVYSFNLADENKAIIIHFSYVPEDIEQAVFEMVAERYNYKDRVGVRSKGLSGGIGENVTYADSDMTEYVRAMLQPYRRIVPV